MIHWFTATYTTMRVDVVVKAFCQIGEEFFPFANWETISPMAQLVIVSASLDLYSKYSKVHICICLFQK